MKPQPSTLSFKRGTPVHYYVGGKPQPLYLGGKLGGYRVLSASPAHLDSGSCIPVEEFPQAVFPAPNQNGCFDRSMCAQIAFSLDRRLKVVVSYIQTGPSTWCAAVSDLVIGDHYRSSPVSAKYNAHLTLEAALGHVLPPLLCELRILASGTDQQLLQRHSLPKSLHGKARRFGREAIYSIITEIPRHIAGDILKSLNGAG